MLFFSQPGHLIRRANQIAWAAFIEETRDLGLTPVQYAALVVISSHPGIDATRLSDLISFDRATIGSVLERLEKKRLITRRSAEDKRSKMITATRAAEKMIARVDSVLPRIAERILHPLKKRDRAHLLKLLASLVDIAGLEGRALLPQRQTPKRKVAKVIKKARPRIAAPKSSAGRGVRAPRRASAS
jgi:DNA-binding MarR family transcriptional regulator